MDLVPATPAREVIQPDFQSLSVKQWHLAGAGTWYRLSKQSAHTDVGSAFPFLWSDPWDVLETFVCVLSQRFSVEPEFELRNYFFPLSYNHNYYRCSVATFFLNGASPVYSCPFLVGK